MTPQDRPARASSVTLNGAAVRTRRVRKRMGGTELAAAAGVTRQWISLIERSDRINVSATVADKLAEALGCRLSAIRAPKTPK